VVKIAGRDASRHPVADSASDQLSMTFARNSPSLPGLRLLDRSPASLCPLPVPTPCVSVAPGGSNFDSQVRVFLGSGPCPMLSQNFQSLKSVILNFQP
jgi:hypothetical protein